MGIIASFIMRKSWTNLKDLEGFFIGRVGVLHGEFIGIRRP
jgi:hypothetical protein